MSTKNTTQQQSTNTLNYDPASMGRYQSLTGNAAGVLNQYMKNPLNNSFFNLGASQAQAGANKLGQQNMKSFMQNYLTSGFGGGAGAAFKTAQMNQIGRSNQALRSQAQIGNIMQAFNRQLGSAGMGLSFNPLMTGTNSTGTSTETKSGLGTWLPQLAGTALGAGMSAMSGGMGGGFSSFLPSGGYGAGTFGNFMGGAGNISSAFGGPASASMLNIPNASSSMMINPLNLPQ